MLWGVEYCYNKPCMDLSAFLLRIVGSHKQGSCMQSYSCMRGLLGDSGGPGVNWAPVPNSISGVQCCIDDDCNEHFKLPGSHM